MNQFEIAVVNEPSVFEPLKFYCIMDMCLYDIYKIRNKNVVYSKCIFVHFGEVFFGTTNPLSNATNILPKAIKIYLLLPLSDQTLSKKLLISFFNYNSLSTVS